MVLCAVLSPRHAVFAAAHADYGEHRTTGGGAATSPSYDAPPTEPRSDKERLAATLFGDGGGASSSSSRSRARRTPTKVSPTRLPR